MINLGFYSGRNCPNVRFQPTVIDRILEGAVLFVILLTWGGIYWLYTQKGLSLSPNVWMMGGISVFCAVLLGVCSYLPIRFINFPVRVNERNAGIQYVLAIRLVRGLNVILSLNFFFTTFMEYSASASLCLNISLVLLVLLFITYYILAFKYK